MMYAIVALTSLLVCALAVTQTFNQHCDLTLLHVHSIVQSAKGSEMVQLVTQFARNQTCSDQSPLLARFFAVKLVLCYP